MNIKDCFPHHYRLKDSNIIREGDMELVQEITYELGDGRSLLELQKEAKRQLDQGKGWQLVPIPRGYHGMKVTDTQGSVTAAMNVWRPRKTRTNQNDE